MIKPVMITDLDWYVVTYACMYQHMQAAPIKKMSVKMTALGNNEKAYRTGCILIDPHQLIHQS